MSTLQQTSGRIPSSIPVIVSLIALGWLLATLWIPQEPIDGNGEGNPKRSQPVAPSGQLVSPTAGSASQDPVSALDSLSPELRSIHGQIHDLFLKTQWNAALDASTAHRVGRARDDLEALLASLGAEHVQMLAGLLKEEQDFVNRRFLLRALGRIGSDEALIALVEHYHWSTGNQKESEVKHTVAALAAADNDRSFEILSEFALSDEDQQHRYRFVGALSQHSRSSDALGIYSQLLRDDSHFRVRQRAAFGMKVSGGPADAAGIEAALLDEGNPYVRQSFLGALGGIRDVRSVPLVTRILQEDSVLSTRVSAVKALLRIEGDAVVDALRAARDDESQPQRVHDEVIRALATLGASG
ncbi:MAG: HEAT repeat domain-containing protein [Planctomycetota bacterium]|nr:HEAT repeat domain-containing protein [Planctomycetota bacterium]